MTESSREMIDIGKLMEDKETTAVLCAGASLEIAKATRDFMNKISKITTQYKDVLSLIEFGLILAMTDATNNGEGEDSLTAAQMIGHNNAFSKIKKFIDNHVSSIEEEERKSVMDKYILVIPSAVKGKQAYAATEDEILKHFHISQAQLNNAIRTGYPVKQHYFDELEDDNNEIGTR